MTVKVKRRRSMQYRTWRHTLKSLPGYDSGQVDAEHSLRIRADDRQLGFRNAAALVTWPLEIPRQKLIFALNASEIYGCT